MLPKRLHSHVFELIVRPTTVLVLALTLVAAGCAETRLASHILKGGGKNDRGGVYKVGSPYKIDGVWYYPRENEKYDETGIASWYGREFHGRKTANGERYDMNALTAAHPTLPMPVKAQVTNLENGRSIVVRVNDRGPFKNGRIIDLSKQSAKLLGFQEKGTAKVRVRYLARTIHDEEYVKKPRISRAERRSVEAAPVGEVESQELAPLVGAEQAPATAIREVYSAPKRSQVVARVYVPGSPEIFVQAGAFLARSNAQRLADQLDPVGKPIAIAQSVIEGRRFFRVRIGPIETVDAADQTLNSVIALGQNDARIIVD
jgi:rare lipoprotein A